MRDPERPLDTWRSRRAPAQNATSRTTYPADASAPGKENPCSSPARNVPVVVHRPARPSSVGGYGNGPWPTCQKLENTTSGSVHHSPPAELLPLRAAPSDYVKRLRDWPGLPGPDRVSGNWYRFTRRDFPIFRDMAQGDCYPEALEVAHTLFRQTLEQMAEPPLPGTQAWEELKAAHVPPYRNDAFHDKWQKLVADRPSWTLTAHLSKDTYSHIHYDSRQARTISIREAARLQSFPDGVEFVGNHGDHYRQIGNAVPPLLARAIAEELFAQLGELGAL